MHNLNDKNFKKGKIGLAFSGGGAKGFVYLGVIKAFEEYGIKFDYIAGTSIGSIFGAFYAAGYTYEQIYEIANELDFKDIKTSKFFPSKTDKLQEILTKNLGDINIENLATPFCAIATDLKTKREAVMEKGNLAKACAGSCAVPGIFVPVKTEDLILCDGGLKNSMPADVLKSRGCDYVISVDITSKNKEIKSTKALDVLLCALQILISDASNKGYMYSDLVISPDVSSFSFRKRANLDKMIAAGYNATKEAMPEVWEIFKSNKKQTIKNYNYIKQKNLEYKHESELKIVK